MKYPSYKILLYILCALFLIYLIIPKDEEETLVEESEKRAVFVSYIELSKYVKGKEEAAIKNSIDDMLDNLKEFGFNMVLLQVRSFSDAIYPSSIFPSSKAVVEEEGDPLPFDLLDYFITEAHDRDLELHAWINPYRIRNNGDDSPIDDTNPAFSFMGTNKVKETEKGLYYNPAEEEVEELILKGIEEILNNYEVDGIHFDDYFYPDDTIDQENYEAERRKNSELTLQEYRLGITTRLIQKTYRLVKKKGKDLLFGISPEGNIDNNYNSNYIDTKLFGREKGYVDYLMPQIYFGFLNETRPFQKTVEEWNQFITEESVLLIPALAFYKVGEIDNYAKSGAEEWTLYHDIIMREVLASRSLSQYAGFSIFRYDFLFGDTLSEAAFLEKENLKKIL